LIMMRPASKRQYGYEALTLANLSCAAVKIAGLYSLRAAATLEASGMAC
jgi:hypothetical protein